MKLELKPHSNIYFNSRATSAEKCFLSKRNPITLTEKEKSELLSPTNEAEISYILEQEVDKDSSPGEDGITYRYISVFWNIPNMTISVLYI